MATLLVLDRSQELIQSYSFLVDLVCHLILKKAIWQLETNITASFFISDIDLDVSMALYT
jgi:hypothetical protein